MYPKATAIVGKGELIMNLRRTRFYLKFQKKIKKLHQFVVLGSDLLFMMSSHAVPSTNGTLLSLILI